LIILLIKNDKESYFNTLVCFLIKTRDLGRSLILKPFLVIVLNISEIDSDGKIIYFIVF